jgi:hypothetical protein
MEATQNSTRDVLIKFFTAPPGEKLLTENEYKAIVDLVDRWRGGFKREVQTHFSEDRELMAASDEHKVTRGRILAEAPGTRDAVLEYLRNPGIKSLSQDQFKLVTPFIENSRQGGLTRIGFEVFREDKEVTAAAHYHRKETLQARAQSVIQGQGKDLEEVKEDTISQVRKKRASSKAQGQEIGD